MNNRVLSILISPVMLFAASLGLCAQVYDGGLIDKAVAVVGNDMILLSDIEEEVRTHILCRKLRWTDL